LTVKRVIRAADGRTSLRDLLNTLSDQIAGVTDRSFPNEAGAPDQCDHEKHCPIGFTEFKHGNSISRLDDSTPGNRAAGTSPRVIRSHLFDWSTPALCD
jgi:hypothetical protein